VSIRSIKTVIAMGVMSVFLFGGLSPAAIIDLMNTTAFGDYQPGDTFMVFGQAANYQLSDGTSWDSGAGTGHIAASTLESVTTTGSTITYTFGPTTSGFLFSQTDFDSGEHSAQGELGLPSALTLTALLGESTVHMKGYTEIVSNTETWYGQPRFNYFTAPVGSRVYFEQTFSLLNDSFIGDLFSRSFAHTEVGYVDFKKVSHYSAGWPSRGRIYAAA
jgi:hypothetical protein